MENEQQFTSNRIPGFTIKLDKRNWTQWSDQLNKISLVNSTLYRLITTNQIPDWTVPKLTMVGPNGNRVRAARYNNDGDEEGGLELYKEDCKELKMRKLKYESDLSQL